MEKEKFYQKTWFVILMLILFAPIGIFLMWKYKTWGKAAKIVVTVIFCFVFIGQVANTATQKDTPVPKDDTNAVVATNAPASSTPQTAAQTSGVIQATSSKDQAKQEEPEPETPKIQTYKSGMYKVGADIGAGEYLITTEIDGYYELSKDSTGNLDSVIANDNFTGTRYLTVKDGEYLTIQNCRMIAAGDATPVSTSDGELSDGMYKVGFDMPAGEYKVHSDGGYIEVSTDSTGNLDSIVSNDNFQGDKYITVSDGQYLTLVNSTLTLK